MAARPGGRRSSCATTAAAEISAIPIPGWSTTTRSARSTTSTAGTTRCRPTAASATFSAAYLRSTEARTGQNCLVSAPGNLSTTNPRIDDFALRQVRCIAQERPSSLPRHHRFASRSRRGCCRLGDSLGVFRARVRRELRVSIGYASIRHPMYHSCNRRPRTARIRLPTAELRGFCARCRTAWTGFQRHFGAKHTCDFAVYALKTPRELQRSGDENA